MKRGLGPVWAAFFLGFIFSIAEADEIRYDSGGRRDPFLSVTGPDSTGGTGDGLMVEGIVFDPGGSSYALINGQIYREGENLESAQLFRILSDRVILLENSEEVVIWLRQEVLDDSQKKSEGGA